MSQNKQTVQDYMEGFMISDHAAILACLTDDVVWEMPGVYKHFGKEAFDKEIENENFVGRPAIKVIRLIEENDVVVAEGTVVCTMKNGNILDAVFCDVFHMRHGKIHHLTSYLVNLNPGDGEKI